MNEIQLRKKRKVIYKVHIFDRQNVVKVPRGIRLDLRRVCHAVLLSEHFGHSAEVNIVFVDNIYIQSLNKQYRGKDMPTDTLSFPSGEDEYEVNKETGAKILGDVILSIEKAQEESEIEHSSIKGKLLFWTAHSLLHLLGYDHEKSRRDDIFMRERAEQVMSSIGYPDWNCRA